jgi:hypothetical protein
MTGGSEGEVYAHKADLSADGAGRLAAVAIGVGFDGFVQIGEVGAGGFGAGKVLADLGDATLAQFYDALAGDFRSRRFFRLAEGVQRPTQRAVQPRPLGAGLGDEPFQLVIKWHAQS